MTCDLRGNADYRDYKNNLLLDITDGVVIATPPITHYEIAKYWIEKRIPVLIEKPVTINGIEAYKLLKLCKKYNTRCMIGHTYLYSPVIDYIKDNNFLGIGDIEYIDIQWKNLGIFQRGGVILDLAPHPLSILFYLFPEIRIGKVFCKAHSHRLMGINDTAIINIEFDKFQANLNLSWLDPQKVRTITIVGKEGMLVIDDTQSTDKLKFFDKACKNHSQYNDYGTFQMSYRYGNTIIYKLDSKEPLTTELSDFLNINEEPRSNMEIGHKVMRIIDKCR